VETLKHHIDNNNIGYDDGDCKNNLLWIMSLSFLCGTFVIVLILVFLRRYTWFQALIYGYSLEYRMSNIEKNIPTVETPSAVSSHE